MPEQESVIVEKIVLSFDICSSSSIIEDLTLTGRFKKWESFLVATRAFLTRNQFKYWFLPYKFTGDGWLLFFRSNVSGDKFFNFVLELSRDYYQRYNSTILPLLENPPAISGITFGADVGNLLKLNFHGTPEYVGRPINIACRLMNAIKDKDPSPAYKVLLSRPLYNSLSSSVIQGYTFKEATRKLRNIRGGEEYKCILASLESD